VQISKLKKRLLEPSANAFVGIDAAILLLTTFGSMALFIGLSVAIANVLQTHFLTVAISMPKLHGADGIESPVLVMYLLLRTHIFDKVILFAIFAILFLFMLEMGGMIKNMTKPYVMRIIIASLLVMSVPYFWDYMAEGVEYGALKLLNPLYSFNSANPCISYVNDPLLASLAQNNMMMIEDIRAFGIDTLEDDYHCSPNLRVHYIFAKAFHGASYDVPDDGNFLEGIQHQSSQLGANIINTLWGGITKATMITFTTLYAISMLVGSKVWLSSILTIFPFLVLLTFIPKVNVVPKKILEMLPGLIMIPIMVAAVIVGGSTGLHMIEQQINAGETIYSVGAGDLQGSDDFVSTNLIFWMTAVTVLLIAATTPALLVPSLMSLSNTVSQAVGSAAISGTIGAISAAKGGIQGGGQAASGAYAAASAAPGSTMGNFFRPETFKSVARGIGSGGGAGVKDAFNADMQGGLGKHGLGDTFKSPKGSGPNHTDSSDPNDKSVIDSGSTVKDAAYERTYRESTTRENKRFADSISRESAQVDAERQSSGINHANAVNPEDVEKNIIAKMTKNNPHAWEDLGADVQKQVVVNSTNVVSAGNRPGLDPELAEALHINTGSQSGGSNNTKDSFTNATSDTSSDNTSTNNDDVNY